jgi:hypothetical protein
VKNGEILNRILITVISARVITNAMRVSILLFLQLIKNRLGYAKTRESLNVSELFNLTYEKRGYPPGVCLLLNPHSRVYAASRYAFFQ